MNDTIAAISTALGVGAISIIRVSGNDSLNIVNKVFKGKDLTKVPSHTIHYGHIISGNEIIDEVLVSVMLSPKTFTTENIAGYYKYLDFSNKNVLTVSASGDHIINAFYKGAQQVCGFDINYLSLLYTELKLVALLNLEYKEFLQFSKKSWARLMPATLCRLSLKS